MSPEQTFLRRKAIVDTLLSSASEGDLDAAAAQFHDDARIVRVCHARSSVVSAETIAAGAHDVREWIAQNIARSVRIRPIEYWEEGPSLAVRIEWSIRGFDGEMVSSTTLGVNDFTDDRIRLLRLTSREEGEGDRAPRRDGLHLDAETDR